MTTYERRYHAAWSAAHDRSPLALLAEWLCAHPRELHAAPRQLLLCAEIDVASRLPRVAAREPTRRHRKHFAWLLGWHLRIAAALEGRLL